MQWHAMKIEDVLSELKTSPKGLRNEDAKERLKKYGLNKITSKERRTALVMFLEEFKSFLVILLMFAVAISLILGLYIDATVIGVILFLNALFGFYQEYKAEKSIEALKKLIVSKVMVIREGKVHEILTEHLVPGDIVLLESGNRVPADVRLMETINLRIDESALTGESVPVEKKTEIVKESVLQERDNIAFMGTLIDYGRGRGVVIDTGDLTEMGKIAGMVQEKEEPTPLQTRLQNFGKRIGIIVIIITTFVFFFGITRNEPPFTMFLTAMSLAISSVPEGLPAVITLTLAIGTQKMAKKNSLVKRLAAVESLGSTTIIAADKTGTMTTNEMTIRKVWCGGKPIDVTGIGFEPKGEFFVDKIKIDPKNEECLGLLIKIGMVCNDSFLKKDDRWYVIGDPTEGSLKVLAMKAGIEYECSRINEIAFSSEKKMMTTIQKINGELVAYTKGAPEIVLENCEKIYPEEKITEEKKEEITKLINDFASKGMRVLGFSFKKLPGVYSIESVERNMTFVGLVGIIDPPKKETKEAIEICKRAGIKTIMITGDHELTAKAIASEIGLKGLTLTGKELDEIDDEKLESVLDEVVVFARVSPQHKLRIVEILKKKGHIVAVTGDGVNDAPALKRADVGISMGIKGTDVAKEASDMILMDDNFSTIVSAVEEGRAIYDNIKKFIRFLLAGNSDEVAIMVFAMFLGLPLPLLPLQILWINLITDSLPALSLGVDHKEKDIMARNPRHPHESILHPWMFIIVAGILASLASFTIFWMELPYGLARARTMTFATTIFFELFFIFNCRSEKRSVFRLNPLANKMLLISIIISAILQFSVIYIPTLQNIFGTVSLGFLDWVKILLFSSTGLFVIPEIFMTSKKSKHI